MCTARSEIVNPAIDTRAFREIPKLSPAESWRLIQATVFDTIGCTEPVAIALAAVRAQRAVGGEVSRVSIALSASVFKNAMSVGIPGSDQKGIRFAVALGLEKGDPDLGLALFADVSPEDSRRAMARMKTLPIEISLAEETGVYIRTEVETGKGTAVLINSGAHDKVVSLTVDGVERYDAGENEDSESTGKEDEELAGIGVLLEKIREMDMEGLVALAESIPADQCRSLLEGVDINMAAAETGIEKKSGMGVGASLLALIDDGSLGGGVINRVKAMAAAGSDARMGGEMVPVKGCGGSGNHGIAFFLSAGLALRILEKRMQKPMERALALGLLLVQYIKAYTGLLTPICGVTVCASAAAAAAIVYGLGGSSLQMLAAVKLIDGNIAGILCDGAKHGCALKVATSSGSAVEAALMVMDGVSIPDTDGIVGVTLKESLANIRRLQDDGMGEADRTMLALLLEKERSGLFGC
jgi:L-cysteine desulfidase